MLTGICGPTAPGGHITFGGGGSGIPGPLKGGGGRFKNTDIFGGSPETGGMGGRDIAPDEPEI